MTYAIYTDADGYIGEVSAPDRAEAVRFLESRGIKFGTYKLCELYEEK